MDQETSRKITVYSMVMAACIVCYHAHLGGNVLCGSRLEETLYYFSEFYFNSLSSLALGWFFMLSAFLLYYNMNESNIKTKLSNRIYTLVIPYIVWNIIVMSYLTVKNARPPFQTVGEFIYRMIFLPFDGPLWYMAALVIWLAVAPVLFRLRKSRFCWGGGIAAILLSFLISVVLAPELSGHKMYWWMERFIRFMPSYMLGATVGLVRPDIVLLEGVHFKKHQIASILFYLLSVILLWVLGREHEGIAWSILELQPVCLWFIISRKRFSRELPYYLKNSFLLFAMHEPVMLPLALRIFTGGSHHTASGYAAIAIRIGIVAFCIAATACLAALLRKLPRLYGILTGGRT